jgi:hypothetical protein
MVGSEPRSYFSYASSTTSRSPKVTPIAPLSVPSRRMPEQYAVPQPPPMAASRSEASGPGYDDVFSLYARTTPGAEWFSQRANDSRPPPVPGSNGPASTNPRVPSPNAQVLAPVPLTSRRSVIASAGLTEAGYAMEGAETVRSQTARNILRVDKKGRVQPDNSGWLARMRNVI